MDTNTTAPVTPADLRARAAELDATEDYADFVDAERLRDQAVAMERVTPAHADHLADFVACPTCSTRSTPVMVHKRDMRRHRELDRLQGPGCCDIQHSEEAPHYTNGVGNFAR